jgi:phosphoserine aminotransferase
MSASLPAQPARKPRSPNFSCGPCTKYPDWTLQQLANAHVGRSHRAKPCKDKLKQVIDESKTLLGLPPGYEVAIIAGSDTGAIEAAMWSLLGPRPVDVFAWEAFGKDWVTDALKELKPLEARSFVTPYGELPDLSQADFSHDVIFTWNGTAAGVKVPNGDWIPADRQGLTFCDATSAIFMQPIPWDKCDVITYSWQKALGSEAAHGMLILSPRAIARLESHTPAWPVPKIFRLTKGGKLNKAAFDGETINTPSMLCVEDVLDAMAWVRRQGGLTATIERTHRNFQTLAAWVDKTSWIDFLCANPAHRSTTSVCLKFTAPDFLQLGAEAQTEFCKKLVGMVEKAGAGYDFNHYRDAPPGLRIWCGTTVEADDLGILTQWIEWAYAHAMAELKVAV